jgi:hypothetical protein
MPNLQKSKGGGSWKLTSQEVFCLTTSPSVQISSLYQYFNIALLSPPGDRSLVTPFNDSGPPCESGAETHQQNQISVFD